MLADGGLDAWRRAGRRPSLTNVASSTHGAFASNALTARACSVLDALGE